MYFLTFETNTLEILDSLNRFVKVFSRFILYISGPLARFNGETHNFDMCFANLNWYWIMIAAVKLHFLLSTCCFYLASALDYFCVSFQECERVVAQYVFIRAKISFRRSLGIQFFNRMLIQCWTLHDDKMARNGHFRASFNHILVYGK